jgi:hypothetical protein
LKCIDQNHGEVWTAYRGDCVEVLKGIPDDSVHYSVFFSSIFPLCMFIQTQSEIWVIQRKMANSTITISFL